MKVLIADDHPMVRDALARTVRELAADAHVLQAGDFESLLRLALDSTNEPADFVLIDLNMPGMNGLEGLRRLREQLPTLPVVVASGQDDPQTIRAVLAAGARPDVAYACSCAPADPVRAMQDIEVEAAAKIADGKQAADHEVGVDCERVAVVHREHELRERLRRLLPIQFQHAENEVGAAQLDALAIDAHEDFEHVGFRLAALAVARKALVDRRHAEDVLVFGEHFVQQRKVDVYAKVLVLR